jgi:hypothetical protein
VSEGESVSLLQRSGDWEVHAKRGCTPSQSQAAAIEALRRDLEAEKAKNLDLQGCSDRQANLLERIGNALDAIDPSGSNLSWVEHVEKLGAALKAEKAKAESFRADHLKESAAHLETSRKLDEARAELKLAHRDGWPEEMYRGILTRVRVALGIDGQENHENVVEVALRTLEQRAVAVNGLRALQAKVREWADRIVYAWPESAGGNLVYEMRASLPRPLHDPKPASAPEPEVCPACQGKQDGHEHMTDAELDGE